MLRLGSHSLAATGTNGRWPGAGPIEKRGNCVVIAAAGLGQWHEDSIWWQIAAIERRGFHGFICEAREGKPLDGRAWRLRLQGLD